MEVPDPGGWTGPLVAAITAIGAGFLLLRKWLSGDSVERGGNAANLRTIEMQSRLLESANTRNEALVKALENSNAQLTLLRQKVAELTGEVFALRDQLERMSK